MSTRCTGVCSDLVLNHVKTAVLALLKDEEGQSTTEYVMLIAVLVTIVFTIGKTLQQKMLGLVQTIIGNQINNGLFANGGVHKFTL